MFSLLLLNVFPYFAYSATVTNFSPKLSRLKQNTASNQEIFFVLPTGIDPGGSITLTYSSDFTGVGSMDYRDIDFAIGNDVDCSIATFTEQALAATASGATWGIEIAAQAFTIHSGTEAIDSFLCHRVRVGTNASYGSTGVHQITNGSSDDDDTISISTTGGDSGTAAVDIITDDQVVVTATVQPTLTFAISANTIEFGNLSSSAATYADASAGNATETEAHTLSASTNAAGGYSITLNGSTLTDGLKTITAIGATNTASSTGTEQFGVRFTASGGSGSVSAPYAASGFAFDSAAFPDEVAASTVPSATTTYSARYLANISATTEAGSYSTTLTYIATGSF